MANTASAKKRMRQDVKRRALNRWRKDQVKGSLKKFEESLKTADEAKMKEALSACFKALDKVAAKGTIHKNAANRKKARLSVKLNKAVKK
ncbi:MAG TPA: 30S ribosomal protein S20 [Phycisphaerae bacterium]|nr:30S ribosomal protein S20 [Phycisphaerae bacterium]